MIESVDEICRSDNMELSLEATLPRLLSAVDFLSSVTGLVGLTPPAFRSGLVFGLDPRRVKAFLNRPTGDGDRF